MLSDNSNFALTLERETRNDDATTSVFAYTMKSQVDHEAFAISRHF
jgi:hypothetical protein